MNDVTRILYATYILDTLAAACAEVGRFDDAVAVLKEALPLPASGQIKEE